MQPRIVVMGPSGSGKSLIGQLLARWITVAFVDADALHPAANVEKMRSGVPLDDADRLPWLDAVGAALHRAPDGVVIACSALRRSYRDRIRANAPDAWFAQLDVPPFVLGERMRTRTHFMPATLLRSQLEVFEPLQSDESGVAVENRDDPEHTVAAIAAAMPWPVDQSLR